MTRFDDPDYVRDWQQHGRFPAIHTRMISAIREEIDPESGVVLDLCSSTGLLGRRLANHGYQVVAVQEPGRALTLGIDAGVYNLVPHLALRITAESLGQLLAWIETQQVRTVVARRCFPELFDQLGPSDFPVLSRELAAAGVERIAMEGRVQSQRTVHPLGSIQQEITALDQHWAAGPVRGPIAVLTRRG